MTVSAIEIKNQACRWRLFNATQLFLGLQRVFVQSQERSLYSVRLGGDSSLALQPCGLTGRIAGRSESF